MKKQDTAAAERKAVIAAMRYFARMPQPYVVRWRGQLYTGTEPGEVVDRALAGSATKET